MSNLDTSRRPKWQKNSAQHFIKEKKRSQPSSKLHQAAKLLLSLKNFRFGIKLIQSWEVARVRISTFVKRDGKSKLQSASPHQIYKPHLTRLKDDIKSHQFFLGGESCSNLFLRGKCLNTVVRQKCHHNMVTQNKLNLWTLHPIHKIESRLTRHPMQETDVSPDPKQ